MRTVLFVATNEVKTVEDQEATDAIASGEAVPYTAILEEVESTESAAIEQAPEVTNFEQAPEIK